MHRNLRLCYIHVSFVNNILLLSSLQETKNKNFVIHSFYINQLTVVKVHRIGLQFTSMSIHFTRQGETQLLVSTRM